MQKLFLCLLLFFAFQLNAQRNNQLPVNDSSITYHHGYHKSYYCIHNNRLTRLQLQAHLNKFQDSAAELSRSQIHLGVSLFFLGSFALSYIVPNPTSVVFSVISIPSFYIETALARKHLRKSVQLYNHEISKYQNQSLI